MLLLHIFDSLAAISPLEKIVKKKDNSITIYDIGSGCGLPGIVFAIMKLNWKINCVDSVEKKIVFMHYIKNILNLKNLEIIHNRIEYLPAVKCDVVISRAFASLERFSVLAGYHVCEDGFLVSMKGIYPENEINILQSFNFWKIYKVVKLFVPELNANRCLIFMKYNYIS